MNVHFHVKRSSRGERIATKEEKTGEEETKAKGFSLRAPLNWNTFVDSLRCYQLMSVSFGFAAERAGRELHCRPEPPQLSSLIQLSSRSPYPPLLSLWLWLFLKVEIKSKIIFLFLLPLCTGSKYTRDDRRQIGIKFYQSAKASPEQTRTTREKRNEQISKNWTRTKFSVSSERRRTKCQLPKENAAKYVFTRWMPTRVWMSDNRLLMSEMFWKIVQVAPRLARTNVCY